MNIENSAIRPATARTGAPRRPATPETQTASNTISQSTNKAENDEDTKITTATEPQAQKLVTSNSDNSISTALNKGNSNSNLSTLALVGFLGSLASLAGNYQQSFPPNSINQPGQTNPSTPVSRDQPEIPSDPVTKDDLISVPQTTTPSLTAPLDSQRTALSNNFTALAEHPAYGKQFKEYFAENATMLGYEVKEGQDKFEDLSHIPNDTFAQSIMLALHSMAESDSMPPIFSPIGNASAFHDNPNIVRNVFAYHEAKGGLASNPNRSLDIGFGDNPELNFN